MEKLNKTKKFSSSVMSATLPTLSGRTWLTLPDWPVHTRNSAIAAESSRLSASSLLAHPEVSRLETLHATQVTDKSVIAKKAEYSCRLGGEVRQGYESPRQRGACQREDTSGKAPFPVSGDTPAKQTGSLCPQARRGGLRTSARFSFPHGFTASASPAPSSDFT